MTSPRLALRVSAGLRSEGRSPLAGDWLNSRWGVLLASRIPNADASHFLVNTSHPVCHCESWSSPCCVVEPMNQDCPGEERSDAAIHLEFSWIAIILRQGYGRRAARLRRARDDKQCVFIRREAKSRRAGMAIQLEFQMDCFLLRPAVAKAMAGTARLRRTRRPPLLRGPRNDIQGVMGPRESVMHQDWRHAVPP